MFLQLLLVTSVSLNYKIDSPINATEHLNTPQCYLCKCNVVAESVALESELCYLLAVWVWPGYFT